MDSRVLIVDDHPIIRTAVRLHLQSQGFEIVGEAGDGSAAIQLITRLKPAILILDIGMPEADGLSVLRRIKALGLSIKTIVLTGQRLTPLASQCIQYGAHGIVHKQHALSELIAAIKARPGYISSPH